MKRFLFTITIAGLSAFASIAQVVNYALQFEPSGTVDCGAVPELDNRASYLVQFWMNPSKWTEGATLIQRGDDFRVSMGPEGVLKFMVAGSSYETSGIPIDEWSLVSFRSNDGEVYINGIRNGTPGVSIPAGTGRLVLGGKYTGFLDEIRIWGSALDDQFNYFEHTTLNKWNPYWDDLIVYYKTDQELCPDLVDYKGIYSPDAAFNHHGVLSKEGVTKVAVDNPGLPYLINSAYTANERFYDRAIPRDQYLLSNDLIILGIESMPDGHLRTCTPNNHATINGAEWMAEFEGRVGVMSFDGNSSLDCGTDIMRYDAPGYTFESWIYVDEWVPGAYIFRKETDDGSEGFSIRLGEESNHEVIVRVNGSNFYNQRQMKSGKWVHLAIGVNGGTTPSQIFYWMYDGTRVGYGSNKCDNSTNFTPTGNAGCHGMIGEGFKGKLDEFVMWDMGLQRGELARHVDGLPMPGLNKCVTADLMQRANTYLSFNDPAKPGYSFYSQDEWKRIMEAAYAGHRGFKTRISVKSHDGWESTLWSAEKRKIFAADLAEISKPYDGVELDLEWIYGEQTQLGYLSDDIRKALPEGKTFMISCHNVAYRFPKSKIANCDGFTFQQYGPQNTHSYYSHFKTMAQTFVDYGFPKEKILCSYATTTSNGYKDGQSVMPIKGVKDGFMEEGFVPDAEIDFGGSDGYTYYFDGPLQTYMRARYVTDNHLGGIFYWDMGNDTRPEHPYNLAKWCSYGLNANVDTLVTEVAVKHYDPLSISAIRDDAGTVAITYDPDTDSIVVESAESATKISVYTVTGQVVADSPLAGNRTGSLGLSGGVYIVRADFDRIVPHSRRIIIKKR